MCLACAPLGHVGFSQQQDTPSARSLREVATLCAVVKGHTLYTIIVLTMPVAAARHETLVANTAACLQQKRRRAKPPPPASAAQAQKERRRKPVAIQEPLMAPSLVRAERARQGRAGATAVQRPSVAVRGAASKWLSSTRQVALPPPQPLQGPLGSTGAAAAAAAPVCRRRASRATRDVSVMPMQQVYRAPVGKARVDTGRTLGGGPSARGKQESTLACETFLLHSIHYSALLDAWLVDDVRAVLGLARRVADRIAGQKYVRSRVYAPCAAQGGAASLQTQDLVGIAGIKAMAAARETVDTTLAADFYAWARGRRERGLRCEIHEKFQATFCPAAAGTRKPSLRLAGAQLGARDGTLEQGRYSELAGKMVKEFMRSVVSDSGWIMARAGSSHGLARFTRRAAGSTTGPRCIELKGRLLLPAAPHVVLRTLWVPHERAKWDTMYDDVFVVDEYNSAEEPARAEHRMFAGGLFEEITDASLISTVSTLNEISHAIVYRSIEHEEVPAKSGCRRATCSGGELITGSIMNVHSTELTYQLQLSCSGYVSEAHAQFFASQYGENYAVELKKYLRAL